MDDLFGGLDNPKPVSRQSKTDFMSDLFGGSNNDSTNLNKGKEFVLDDKYKKLAEKPTKPEPVNNRTTNTVTIRILDIRLTDLFEYGTFTRLYYI